MGREHHYVPQFYLRNFSTDARSINRLGVDDLRFVGSASIRCQCRKRGFYDFHPKAEHTLSLLEGRAAAVIRQILDDGGILNISADDRAELYLFVVMQQCRTTAMASENNEVTDWLAKMWMAADAEKMGIDLDEVQIHDRFPSAIPISVAIKIAEKIGDLDVHLLINETGEQFITSDNPVVLHNPFAQGVTHIGVGGWECRGIVVFLPLSPRATLMVYDSEVYQAHNIKYGHVNARRSDVICLNRLQLLNCEHSLYFQDAGMKQLLCDRATQTASLRKEPRVRFVRTDPVKTDEGNYKELIGHYRLLPPMNVDLNILNIRKRWEKVPSAKRAPLWRHYPFRPFQPTAGDVVQTYSVRSDGPKDYAPPNLHNTD